MKRMILCVLGLLFAGQAMAAESSVRMNRNSQEFKNSGQLLWMTLINPAAGDTNDVYSASASDGAAYTYTFTAAQRATFKAAAACNSSGTRNATITVSSATTTDVSAADPVLTGLNALGETITETFNVAADTPATITGAKCFADIVSVAFPTEDGSVNWAVGFGNKFGAPTTMLVGGGATSTFTAQGQVLFTNCNGSTNEGGTWTVDDSAIESNGFTPTTTPDGSIDWMFLIAASPIRALTTATRGW